MTAVAADISEHEAETTSAHGGIVPSTRTLTAGNGLTGGGTLAANRALALGTPGSLTPQTTNAATGDTHTHLVATASQAQAQAGAVNTAYMTPLRTKEYVDQRLQNAISFRISGGVLQYYDGSGWQSMPGVKSVQRGSLVIPDATPLDVTISAVNVNKSFVLINNIGYRAFSDRITSISTIAELTNSTTITITRSYPTHTEDVVAVWQVIEYY